MIFNRTKYIAKLAQYRHNGLIKVVTGLRRVGKSFLLFNLFRKFLEEHGVDARHIICIQLDSFAHRKFRKAEKFYEYIEQMTQVDDNMYYVMIDEVQMLEDFVDVLNGLLHMRHVDVYVTGSNAKFLSSDIVTEFRGRGVQLHLQPLSFAELMEIPGAEMMATWRDYMCYGGLPMVVLSDGVERKAEVLRDLWHETYLTDIIARNRVKCDAELEELLCLLASNIGALTNPYKIANTFTSDKHVRISHETIKLYIDYVIDAFLLSRAVRYDIKGKRYIDTPFKYYFEDVGLCNALLGFRQLEPTHLMENIIYNQLLRMGYSVDVGNVIHYIKNAEGKTQRQALEIDFVCNRGSERLYVQSAYSMPDADKLWQEQRSLTLTGDSFKKIILTTDQVPTYTTDNGICVMNVWEWLCEKDDVTKL